MSWGVCLGRDCICRKALNLDGLDIIVKLFESHIFRYKMYGCAMVWYKVVSE